MFDANTYKRNNILDNTKYHLAVLNYSYNLKLDPLIRYNYKEKYKMEFHTKAQVNTRMIYYDTVDIPILV